MTLPARVQRGTVQLGGKRVDFSIRSSAGATRRRIRVTPNGVEVVIPRGGEPGNATAFLRENEAWVLEQLNFVERLSGLIRNQVRPMTILLRGEERKIRVEEETTTRRYGIVLEGPEELIVRVPTDKKALAGRALELWLRRMVRADLYAALVRRASEMRVKFGRVYVMSQRTRWGGCSSRHNLSFNWRLVMAPPTVLDHLAVHELAHLLEPSHSSRFWLIVRSHCPDFQRHKKWLSENDWRLTLPPDIEN
jgi:predicted metal-dependent hydrolase